MAAEPQNLSDRSAVRQAAALDLRGIVAGYGEATVLRDVSIAVRPGSIVALLGANGAGKTTMMRVASGLLAPSSGQVLIGDNDVTDLGPERRVRAGLCLVPEGRGVFPNLTVRENLELQIPRWAGEKGYERALEAFPILRDRLGQLAGTMSGGEQQSLAVARCYLSEPAVVLIDEVSMGLAPRIIDQIFDSLVQLAKEGVSLLLVEQYVSKALEIADTVYLLDRGKLAFSGRSEAIDEETIMAGYLGTDIGNS
jgi:branched-chain amino acid transport system ATP-binding protein